MPRDFVRVTLSLNGANGEESGFEPEEDPNPVAAQILFQLGNRDPASHHESHRLYLIMVELLFFLLTPPPFSTMMT